MLNSTLVRWFLLSLAGLAVGMSGAADAVAIPIGANFTQAFRPPNTPASLRPFSKGVPPRSPCSFTSPTLPRSFQSIPSR